MIVCLANSLCALSKPDPSRHRRRHSFRWHHSPGQLQNHDQLRSGGRPSHLSGPTSIRHVPLLPLTRETGRRKPPPVRQCIARFDRVGLRSSRLPGTILRFRPTQNRPRFSAAAVRFPTYSRAGEPTEIDPAWTPTVRARFNKNSNAQTAGRDRFDVSEREYCQLELVKNVFLRGC